MITSVTFVSLISAMTGVELTLSAADALFAATCSMVSFVLIVRVSWFGGGDSSDGFSLSPGPF